MATEEDTIQELDEQRELLGITAETPIVGGFNTAALFLLDLPYENLYEPIGGTNHTDRYRCKGCGQPVTRGSRERHHGAHKRAALRGDYGTKKGSGNMATATLKKAKAPTAKEQGFPAPYLAPNGNFRPGLDARAKSDLVAAALEIDNPKALHQFTKAEAEALLQTRGWWVYVEKKQRLLKQQAEAKATRDEKRAVQTKATAAKKASSKSGTARKPANAATGSAKPDPKPKRQAKKAGGRLSRVK